MEYKKCRQNAKRVISSYNPLCILPTLLILHPCLLRIFSLPGKGKEKKQKECASELNDPDS